MEPVPDESSPTSAYGDTEFRLTKLETAVTDLRCDNTLLRQKMESGFQAAQVQLALTEEKLRREFHDGLHALEQRLESKLHSEIQILAVRLDRQDAKIDQLARWMIGAQVTTMAFVAGIAIQLFLR